jgi:hypothetical protein
LTCGRLNQIHFTESLISDKTLAAAAVVDMIVNLAKGDANERVRKVKRHSRRPFSRRQRAGSSSLAKGRECRDRGEKC